MIVEARNGVKALLVGFAFTLYDTQVPDEPTLPYAVWRMTSGYGEGTKVCGTTDKETMRVYVTSVGATAEAAAIVADAARTALLDQRPAVVGWSASNRLRRETSIPIQEDRDVTLPITNRHPVYGVDTYVFESRKD